VVAVVVDGELITSRTGRAIDVPPHSNADAAADSVVDRMIRSRPIVGHGEVRRRPQLLICCRGTGLAARRTHALVRLREGFSHRAPPTAKCRQVGTKPLHFANVSGPVALGMCISISTRCTSWVSRCVGFFSSPARIARKPRLEHAAQRVAEIEVIVGNQNGRCKQW